MDNFEEVITEEELKKVLDDYGNTRYLLEDMKSAKEKALKDILSKYPEVQDEIEAMEAELDSKLKHAEDIEKQKKKNLQVLLDQYAQVATVKDKAIIKSDLVRVSIDKEVKYDSAALDGMAMENPKLLAFRTEKFKTRITLNNK